MERLNDWLTLGVWGGGAAAPIFSFMRLKGTLPSLALRNSDLGLD